MRKAGTSPFGTRRAKLAVWYPLLLGLIFALASCDNNPHPRSLHTHRPDGSPWTVYYGNLGEDPRTLDPQVSYDTVGHAIIAQIYDGLLQYNLFKTAPYELEPCLAESMPRRVRNPDGTEYYEFKLKRGIYFHGDACFPDGKGHEVTTADIVYTFQRIADPKVECPVLSSLQEFIVGLGPSYAEARKRGSFDYAKPTGAITTIDAYTFRLNLLKPYPQILYWLAMPFTAPVPREAVQLYDGKNGREQFKYHPVGAGPYRLKEWARGRLIRLERNARYTATRFPKGGWPATDAVRFNPLAGAPIPFIDEVQMGIIREAIPGWLLFRQGYLDRSGISKDVFNSVLTSGLTLSKKYEARGVRLYRDTEPGTFYLVFNMEDPLLGKNRKLRQAIATAYNATQSIQIFMNGVSVKAEQLLPPGVVGYDPGFKNPYRTEDVAEAKRLLAVAGYPGGVDPKTGRPLEITLDVVADSSAARQMAEFEKSQVEQLGIRCVVSENNWARFQDKQDRGAFQMNSGSGWNADYPDPENFFFLFYSKNIPPQGSNHCRYSNPEFDRLYEKMAMMDNGPERLAIIRELNAILTEDCPIVLLFHPVTFTLNQPWLPRTASNAMVAGGLKYARLDPTLREQEQRLWNRTPLWPVFALAGLVLLSGGAVFWRIKRCNL